jgi:hypothetical protein
VTDERVFLTSSHPRKSIVVVLLLFLALPAQIGATELKHETAQAFQHYVELTEARIQAECGDAEHFMYFDSLPDSQKEAMLQRLHDGQVVVQPMRTTDHGKAIEIPGGLVHHWLSIGFMPGATLEQALALARDYPRQEKIYGPDVQKARLISHEGQDDTVYFRFYRQTIVTVTYNTEFRVDYFEPGNARACTTADATRIAEVQNAGKPDEKEYPVGNDHGYMWRLNLYTRYEQKDGGVYMQEEFLALSRRVPVIFAWLVNPYVRSIPREYLTQFFLATRKALAEPTTASQ